MKHPHKILSLVLLFLLPVAVQAGEKSILGALIGAGAGAAIGHSVNRGGGAGTGALIGGIGGYFIGHQMDMADERKAEEARQNDNDSYSKTAVRSSQAVDADSCHRANSLISKAGQSTDLEQRIYTLEEAVRICPMSARAHNDLGVAYYTRGKAYDRERARIQFERALEIAPDYQLPRQNLARIRSNDRQQTWWLHE